jgi:hypothetical protein
MDMKRMKMGVNGYLALGSKMGKIGYKWIFANA